MISWIINSYEELCELIKAQITTVKNNFHNNNSSYNSSVQILGQNETIKQVATLSVNKNVEGKLSMVYNQENPVKLNN